MLQRLVLLQAQRRDPGLTLLVALVAAVVIVTAAASLTSRTLSTQMGTSNLGASREAHEAAEAGLATVISELNRQRNRQLLTAAVPMSQWREDDPRLTNICATRQAPRPEPAAIALGKGVAQEVIGSNGLQRFTLLAMEVRTADRRSLFSSTSSGSVTNVDYNPRLIQPNLPGGHGYLRLEVKGEVLDAKGGVSSTTTIARDFKLIPKGCRRGPGAEFGYGNELRPELMRPLIVGFDGGGLTNSSSTSSTGSPLDMPVCLALATGKCATGTPTSLYGAPFLTTALGTTLADYLPPASLFPCGTAGGCTNGFSGATSSATGPNHIGVNASGEAQFCRIDPATQILSACVSLTNFCNVLPAPASLPASLTGYPASYHCRLKTIGTASGETLYIDSSRNPIFLYVNAPWRNGFLNALNGEIVHTNCPATTLSASEGCVSPAPLPNATTNPIRAGIFSDATGSITITGQDSLNNLWLFAPWLTVNFNPPVGSTPDFFTGAIWVDSIDLGPASRISLWPDINTGTAAPLIGRATGVSPSPFQQQLSYDVVARPCSSADCATGAAP